MSARDVSALPDDTLMAKLRAGLGEAPEAELLAAADTLTRLDGPVLPVAGCAQPALNQTLAAAVPVRFEFPPGYSPSARHTLWECGANARHNRYVEARITRQIREDVVKLAKNQRTPHFTGPVTILVVQHPPKGRRGLDSENVAPLGKAAIDGLRDAGVLVNDTSKWVPTVSYTTGERVERGQLVLLITPVDGAR